MPLAKPQELAHSPTIASSLEESDPNMQTFLTDTIDTPLGEMIIVTDEQAALRALEWTDLRDRMARLLARQYKSTPFSLYPSKAPVSITQALSHYFSGDLNALNQLVTVAGGTVFQRRVWTALRAIPVGETRSYKDIAIAIDNPKAVRAIGLANGANPIGIVVPCHRVIGANGNLTGYGGGITRKHWLLTHERARGHLLV